MTAPSPPSRLTFARDASTIQNMNQASRDGHGRSAHGGRGRTALPQAPKDGTLSECVPSFEDYRAIFERYGSPGEKYMRSSYPRFIATKRILAGSPFGRSPVRMLDVGSHWLHHAVLYAMDGIAVTGADKFYCPPNDQVRAIARDFNIAVVGVNDLSAPSELDALPENSFDVVLFAEILEHITFNPVAMWRSIYRLLRPGGRIIVTTPNYFGRDGGIRRDLLSVLRLHASGLSVREVVETNTFGHHWRLYSARDVVDYFGILSSDFKAERVEYFDTRWPRPGVVRLVKAGLRRLFPFVKDAIYVEIELSRKEAGITPRPHW
jgi:2-polyprenyl-6-hydroxyphenyl methylase/3-demethylubiquinone-9 3-methyltransferase